MTLYLNALSNKFIAEAIRDGNSKKIICEKGELVDDYESCHVSCPSYDDHLTNGELTVEISFALGGWFMTAAEDIDPYYSYDYNIDLSSNGEIPEIIS